MHVILFIQHDPFNAKNEMSTFVHCYRHELLMDEDSKDLLPNFRFRVRSKTNLDIKNTKDTPMRWVVDGSAEDLPSFCFGLWSRSCFLCVQFFREGQHSVVQLLQSSHQCLRQIASLLRCLLTVEKEAFVVSNEGPSLATQSFMQQKSNT